MNKIIINHDLLTTLEYAKKGFSLKENSKKSFAITLPAAFIGCTISHQGINTITNSFIEELGVYLCSTSFICLSNLAALAVVDSFFKETQQGIAEDKLRNLAKQLKQLDVNTNPELLKKSRLLKREYHFSKDKEKNGIESDKYIEIAIQNNLGQEFSETLLQQHILGSKEYEISVQSPNKKLVHKLVRYPM